MDGLDLQIAQGELFALLGVNGAGKTTTIKMLSGLSRPTSGDARLLGHSILSDSHVTKQFTNVSPQETAVAGNLSVEENLELMACIYGLRRTEAQRRAHEMIERFSLDEVAHDKARILSGGWQRRLSIAMALITDPQILFLDEPTLGLDVLARRELWSIIETLKGKITIILTTHYMEEAEALSDRIGIMVAGKMLAVGSAAEHVAATGTRNFEDAFVKLVSEKGGAR